MQKIGVLLFIFMLSINAVSGLNETDTDRGYSCLETQVEAAPALSLEDTVFSLLSLAHIPKQQTELKNRLLSMSKNDGECWPKDNCKVKETALAVIALNHIRADTEKAEEFLLKQNTSTAELDWFLQIDSASSTVCKIAYDNTNHSINIGEDKKISQNAGSCLSLANGNYWLKVSQNCFQKEFVISCDKDFVSSIFFQKRGSDIFHLPLGTSSAAAKSFTKHTVNSLCFKEGSSCVYEGSLWATLSLQKKVDTSAFIPFLAALAQGNEKFGSDAFLFLITGEDEHFTKLAQLQNQQGFWDFSSGFGRFYDTALSLLALQSVTASSAVDSAKTFLTQTQQTSGCWNNNNIRDTAFILHAIAGKEPSGVVSATGDSCSDAGNYCMSSGECNEANGKVLKEFFCSGVKVCCDKQAKERTCNEKDGISCSSGQVCNGDLVPASDTSKCCVGSCVEEELSARGAECVSSGGVCKSSCASGEEELSLDCGSVSICCKQEQKGSSWWIWLLVVLIVIVIILIIFRNHLRLWVFKIRNKFSSGAVTTSGKPPMPPPGAAPTGLPRRQQFVPRGAPARVASRPTIQKPGLDKDLDETMKKLREIGQ